MCGTVCAVHDLPYFSIDKMQWQPNWVPTPAETFEANHTALLCQKRWLIDGYGPINTVTARLDKCDTVILIDHPILIHFWWATKRQIKSLFVGRPDGPEDCPMWRVTFRLYKMMWWLHREMRPTLLEAIYDRADRLRIIHIKSPAELRAFTANPV